MDEMVIEGGRPLHGEVQVSGAKNSCLPIMAATLLTDDECVIENAPVLQDVETMGKILQALGSTVRRDGNRLIIKSGSGHKCTAPYSMVRTMRASVCVLGPLLAKRKRAKVSLPGGCIIGPRPIDLHLKGLRQLGAKIAIEHGYVVSEAPALAGSEIYLGGNFGSSVLATDNVLMAAVLSRGRSVIENAACEPEVEDLAQFLIAMGARIKGAGTHRLEIEGVDRLHGVTHAVIPDRIEAGTYLIACAMSGGRVTVKGARSAHLGALMDKLRQAGVGVAEQNGATEVWRTGPLTPVNVTTLQYPGFPTDLQAQMMALMSVTEGISVITEKIYPDRFMHVAELNRMGCHIFLEGSTAIVSGVKRLSGAPVMASDLRASAALVLAGLVADGPTAVSRIYHLDRGYEQIVEKLSGLGAVIRRQKANTR